MINLRALVIFVTQFLVVFVIRVYLVRPHTQKVALIIVTTHQPTNPLTKSPTLWDSTVLHSQPCCQCLHSSNVYFTTLPSHYKFHTNHIPNKPSHPLRDLKVSTNVSVSEHSVGWTFAQNFSSLALSVWDCECLEDILTKRDIPEWPHQSYQPNLNHLTNVKWKTRWESRDGITLHVFPAYRCWELDQLFIRRHPNNDLKWTKLCFGPI